MATIETFTLSSDDTATILRARLGPHRAWRDFLRDCIRGRAGINGVRLMPCAGQECKGLLRPVYSKAEIDDFMKKVLTENPDFGPAPFKKTTLAIDPSKIWWLNKFDKYGVPMPM